MIPWLDPQRPVFPDPATALRDPDGLLAAGGNLSADTLLAAYRRGIFPWYAPPDPILWWSPDPRAVLIPDRLHVSRSMHKLIKRRPFTVSCDQAFREVMLHCAAPRRYTADTWISDEMIAAYTRLHQLGYAHSVEVWQQDRLVGGLYGLAIGRVFFGESMFSRVDNASKYAFILLARQLQQAGFALIDCQVASAHLQSLGACTLPRAEFQLRLQQAIDQPPLFSPWTPALL